MPAAAGPPAHPRFKGLSPKAYEHPADRAATAALQRIPFFDALVKKLLEFRFERALMQELLGNAVRVGSKQLPAIWDAHGACYAALDVDPVPALYALQNPAPLAMAIGAHKPTVLVSSGMVGMLDDRQLRSTLAHEAGHVLSEHVRYRTTLELLLRFSLPRLPVLGRAPLQALRLALMAWYRAAELSCDRAAAIVLRDPLIPCTVLMKMAGGDLAELNLDAFVQQADDYVEWDDLFDRRLRLRGEITATHPFPVRRVHELTRWVRSGEYDRIVDGRYVRRGEEPPPSAEFSSAVDHYTERFKELLERTGVGINQLSKRLAAWIESLRGDVDADPESDED
jgi:Zn-dependent protease with chaperone function